MFYNSAIINWISRIYDILSVSCSESFIFAFFRRLGRSLGRLANSSWIVTFVKKEGILSRVWRYSGTGTALDNLFNLPSRLLRSWYLKREQVFAGSLIFRLVMYLIDNLHIAIALFLILAIVIPQAHWSNTYNLAASLIFLILYFLKTVVRGDKNLFTKVFDVFLILFIISVVLGYVFSLIPADSKRFLAFYLSCFIMMAMLALSIENKKQLMLVIELLLIGMTLSGLYGVWQGIKGVPVNASQVDLQINEGIPGRIYSTMENSNNFAIALTLLLPFYLAIVFNSKNLLKKVLFLGLSVPCLVSLVLTYSRSGWIGFAIAVLVLVFFKKKMLIPIFLLVGILVFPFLPQSIYRRLATIVNPTDTSMGTRMDIYKTVWPMIKDYWMTGLGLGNDVFRKMIQNYYMFSKMIPAHSHDLYLQVWIETGIVGLLSFLGFMAGLIKKCIKGITGSKDAVINNILIAGVAAIIGVCAIGVVEYVWFYARVMLLFWSVIGIMLAALAIGNKEANEQENKQAS